MAGDKPQRSSRHRSSGLKLGIWQGMPFEGIDGTVAEGLVGGGRRARQGRRAL